MPRRLAHLHAVTDDMVLAASDFLDVAAAVLAQGGDRVAVHVRGPRSPATTILEATRALLQVSERTGGRVVVNDRVDVVLALRGAPVGVHLGERSLSPVEVRRLLPSVRIGRSVHPPQVEAETITGADYLFVGPVYPTPSHRGESGLGAEGVKRASEAYPCSVVAIGGITPDRVPELMDAGAEGVAAIRGIWSSDDPAEAVSEYLEAALRHAA